MNPVLTEVKTENIFPFKKILLPGREADNKAEKLKRVNIRIIYIFLNISSSNYQDIASGRQRIDK